MYSTRNPNNPYDSRIGNGGLPQGIWGAANRAYTRAPEGNEMVANQLTNLTGSNSRYLDQARRAAAAQAAGRGMGAGSSYAVGNAEGAAIRAAMPIAQQDASTFATAAQDNQRWLNEQMISAQNRDASAMSANASADAARFAAATDAQNRLQLQREHDAYGGEMQGLDRAFQQSQTDRMQGYMNNNAAMQDFYNGRSWLRDQYGQGVQQTIGSMTSNPDFFSNPDAALGFVSGWSDYIGNMLSNFVGK